MADSSFCKMACHNLLLFLFLFSSGVAGRCPNDCFLLGGRRGHQRHCLDDTQRSIDCDFFWRQTPIQSGASISAYVVALCFSLRCLAGLVRSGLGFRGRGALRVTATALGATYFVLTICYDSLLIRLFRGSTGSARTIAGAKDVFLALAHTTLATQAILLTSLNAQMATSSTNVLSRKNSFLGGGKVLNVFLAIVAVVMVLEIGLKLLWNVTSSRLSWAFELIYYGLVFFLVIVFCVIAIRISLMVKRAAGGGAARQSLKPLLRASSITGLFLAAIVVTSVARVVYIVTAKHFSPALYVAYPATVEILKMAITLTNVWACRDKSSFSAENPQRGWMAAEESANAAPAEKAEVTLPLPELLQIDQVSIVVTEVE